MNEAMPWMQVSTVPVTHRILAVGRALERDDLDLVARRRELLVEIGRDAVDQLERADPETLSSALAFGAAITNETAANKTGRRRFKNEATGMAILSANTKFF